MHYTKTADFNGNFATAITVVTAVLTASGFRLVAQDGRRLEFVATRSCAGREGHWNPLQRASKITFTGSSRQLVLEADFGGARNVARWAIVPIGVAVIGVGATIAKTAAHTPQWTTDKLMVLAASIVPVLAIAVFVPLAMRMAGRRTDVALDLILENAAMAARATG